MTNTDVGSTATVQRSLLLSFVFELSLQMILHLNEITGFVLTARIKKRTAVHQQSSEIHVLKQGYAIGVGHIFQHLSVTG